MADVLPTDIKTWQHLETLARNHMARACITEIRTPLLEATELFARGIGDGTDVVAKEMYSFIDRGDRNCTLRPEGTAGVVRAAIQNGLLSQGPQKLWYGGPMFRYERPQAGRMRQFHQLGLEFLGFNSAQSDVEAITIAWDLLLDLGLTELQLELNSLGTKEDRLNYRDQLMGWLEQHKNQLDPDSQSRIHTNPLRILDSKDPNTQALLKSAPQLTAALSQDSLDRFKQVQQGLIGLEIPFVLNPRLVRGLDYYGHTAFEITSNALGAQATVCGGGRYDGLVEQLGGAPTACIGWAMGLERIVLLMQGREINQQIPDIYLISKGPIAEKFAQIIARKLRSTGLIVDLDLSQAAFSKQLKRASKSNADWAVMIGEEEAKSKSIRLKNLGNGAEELINLDGLIQRFQA
jgi:histidyl-tRNA synthetase